MNLQSEDSAGRGAYAFAKAISPEEVRRRLSEQHEPPALSLDERGMILDCSKSFRTLFGFRRSDLVWQHVSTLFPQLADIELVQAGQVNSLLNYLCRCGKLYQAINRQGDTFSINLSFVRIEYKGKGILRLIVHPFAGGGCDGVA
jgi:PAS domain S-box-containing protein